MTDAELDRIQRLAEPSRQRKAVRRQKLKMRYGKDFDTLQREIERTREKLNLLIDILLEKERKCHTST